MMGMEVLVWIKFGKGMFPNPAPPGITSDYLFEAIQKYSGHGPSPLQYFYCGHFGILVFTNHHKKQRSRNKGIHHAK
jgi:hypothetical protein